MMQISKILIQLCAAVAVLHLAGCGGGGGGENNGAGSGSVTGGTAQPDTSQGAGGTTGGGSTSAGNGSGAGSTGDFPTGALPASLSDADVLNLYPSFAMSMLGVDSSLMLGIDFRVPFLTNDYSGVCPSAGSVSVTGGGSTYRVAYANCSTVLSTAGLTAPNQPTITTRLVKQGAVGYQLNATGGDFAGARNDMNIDWTANFDALTSSTSVSMTGQPTVVMENTYAGSVRWAYTHTDAYLFKGTASVSSNAWTLVSRINGNVYKSTVSNAHTLWTINSSEVQRQANLTLALSDGPFSGKPITVTNTATARIPIQIPDFSAATPSGDQLDFFTFPVAGGDMLQYGNSRVYAVYTPDGTTLEIDADNNGCLESRITVTRDEMRAAVFGEAALPAGKLQKLSGCVGPTYRSSSSGT